MQITIIEDSFPFLDEVIRLADENSATLGFLPKEAFYQQAADQRIFVAINKKNEVVGYLLYGTNQRESLVYITHLCVNQLYRGKGISKLLFERLVESTKYRYWAIRVRCRREYVASKIWPKLGFHVRGEIKGRSKRGSVLTVWWYDFGHPTLFTYSIENQSISILPIVIDASIFYDLSVPPNVNNELSHSLLADWLGVELCLTNEIQTEINRNDDKDKRQHSWSFVNNFNLVESPNELTLNVTEKLRDLFPKELSSSDASDMRQIAKTIAAKVKFFVTKDRELLKKSESVDERFGMKIVHPSELIIHRDTLIRESEYQPARIAGSRIQQKRFSENSVVLENLFQQPDGERKSEFRQKIQHYLADPHTFEVDIINCEGKPLALIVYSRKSQEILEIPLLRVLDNPLSSTLAIHLIHNAVTICCKENRILTKLSNQYLSQEILNALIINEFVQVKEFWVKANLPGMEKIEGLKAKLEILLQLFPNYSDYFSQISEALESIDSGLKKHTLLKVEKSLWPAKITSLDLPVYIVSIHPQWAMELFDPIIANQTLFGSDPFLMLNIENVYYRSSRTKLVAPARILWYVNHGRGNFQGTMSIRACSYLDEVIVDKPKVLFTRFKRLGIYTWADVFQVAKKDINRDIMAFKFSKTEVFNHPYHRKDLNKLWSRTKGNKFNIQAPIRINNDMFLKIYESGIRV